MSRKKRQIFSGQQKAKVALEAIRGVKSVNLSFRSNIMNKIPNKLARAY